MRRRSGANGPASPGICNCSKTHRSFTAGPRGEAVEPPRPPAVHSSPSNLGQSPLATPAAFAWLGVTGAHSIPRFGGAGAKRQTTVSLPHGMICRSVKGFGLLGTQCGRPRWFSQRNPSLASRSAGLELSRRTQRRRRAWPKSLVAWMSSAAYRISTPSFRSASWYCSSRTSRYQ